MKKVTRDVPCLEMILWGSMLEGILLRLPVVCVVSSFRTVLKFCQILFGGNMMYQPFLSYFPKTTSFIFY